VLPTLSRRDSNPQRGLGKGFPQVVGVTGP
jgi:hypothetical protein